MTCPTYHFEMNIEHQHKLYLSSKEFHTQISKTWSSSTSQRKFWLEVSAVWLITRLLTHLGLASGRKTCVIFLNCSCGWIGTKSTKTSQFDGGDSHKCVSTNNRDCKVGSCLMLRLFIVYVQWHLSFMCSICFFN